MRVRRVLWGAVVWSAPVGMALVWLTWATCFFWGGLVSVLAWMLGQLLLPLAAVLALPVLGLVAVVDRRGRVVACIGAVAALFALAPVLQLLGVYTPAYPSTIEGTTPHAHVRLPLQGPVVVGWGGDSSSVNYHVATPDQRWAYDLLVEPAGHGSGDLQDYGCYGLPVVAPADGVIAKVHTGEPDQDPSAFVPNYTAPAGNWLALKLHTGTYLILAHFAPGSLVVKAGDAVIEGQRLGACGNSGNTSEPHVHVHHQRQYPEVFGVAEGLPLFFRDHSGRPMPKGGLEVKDGRVHLLGDRIHHVGPKERPE